MSIHYLFLVNFFSMANKRRNALFHGILQDRVEEEEFSVAYTLFFEFLVGYFDLIFLMFLSYCLYFIGLDVQP